VAGSILVSILGYLPGLSNENKNRLVFKIKIPNGPSYLSIRLVPLSVWFLAHFRKKCNRLPIAI
jgi:hypothetical protein